MVFGNLSLIAYRSDYGWGARSVSFTGQQWRDYVPIRVSTTRCIYHALPPGCVAILVNRSHEPSDSLPLTWAQNRLFHAINGFRTLGEIVTACGTSKGAQRALQFFEKLYQHDHIVFDASRVVAISRISSINGKGQSPRAGS